MLAKNSVDPWANTMAKTGATRLAVAGSIVESMYDFEHRTYSMIFFFFFFFFFFDTHLCFWKTHSVGLLKKPPLGEQKIAVLEKFFFVSKIDPPQGGSF